METARANGARVLPVDEPNITPFSRFCREIDEAGLDAHGIDSIILTASGGPFLDKDFDRV